MQVFSLSFTISPSFDCVFCGKDPGLKCIRNASRIAFDGNPIICDCKDYNIISYDRSLPFSTFLDDIYCAAPSEMHNKKVSAPPDIDLRTFYVLYSWHVLQM